MRSRSSSILVAGLMAAAFAAPAMAGESAPPPADVVTIDAGGEALTLWPFTTENYLPGAAGKSDPVNLVFLYTDPRAVRQALMTLKGIRPDWSFLPSGAKGCVWMDGMGYDQAAYLEPEGWVGDEVQLVCATPDSPLGKEYRFHVRLFRSGPHTIGGAHFEINVPNTAEHEALSWEMGRDFVEDEIARIQDDAFLGDTQVFLPAGGKFRTVRGLVNAYVWATNLPRGADGLVFLGRLGLPQPPSPPPPPTPYDPPPVPMPATGLAAVFAPAFTFVPQKSDFTLTDSRTYAVQIYKPFCDPVPVQITGGPLKLKLRIQTNPSGKYQRTFTVAGTLKIKTLSTGVVQDAVISQVGRGMITENYGQVAQEVSQVLLPKGTTPGQSLYVLFGAGQTDYWMPQQNCSIP